MKTLATFYAVNAFPVAWTLRDGKHEVRYGKSRKTYGNSLSAAREFGECVRHALESAGLLTEEN